MADEELKAKANEAFIDALVHETEYGAFLAYVPHGGFRRFSTREEAKETVRTAIARQPRSRLQIATKALLEIMKGAPASKPEWGHSEVTTNYGDVESNGYDIAHYHFAGIARAALEELGGMEDD